MEKNEITGWDIAYRILAVIKCIMAIGMCYAAYLCYESYNDAKETLRKIEAITNKPA